MLETALEDKDRSLRLLGVYGSAALTDPPWSKLADLARSDRVADVRMVAIQAAWRLGPGPRAREGWISEHPIPMTPAPREEWLPLLIAALHDSATQVRTAAANTLRLAGERSALEALREAAQREPDPLVRDTLEVAVRGLEALGEPLSS